MDEYTALQKYILFYRDTRTNPHAEKTTKKKAWWQFWKSGSPTAAEPIDDAGAVPDERKLTSHAPSILAARRIASLAVGCAQCTLCCGRLCASGGCMRRRPSSSYLALQRTQACALVEPIRGDPLSLQPASPPNYRPLRSMRDEHHDSLRTAMLTAHRSHQHPAPLRSHFARRGNPSQAIWLQRDFV
jgi:hypothetical protein